MKKLISTFVIITVLISLFSGCKQEEVDPNQLSVVATIFPAFDFARQVVKDHGQVSMLLPPGAESHSYEPTPKDIIKIQNCDLFIYVGGVSDQWVESILSSLKEPVKTLKLMDCVTVVPEEIIEGMQEEHDHKAEDHDHDHDYEEADVDHGDYEYDEHVWTSPINAIKILEQLMVKMGEIDTKNKADYEENGEEYIGKIKDLDEAFRTFIATVENKTMVFGDRFPFRYFTDEYGLKYYAAFPGCAETAEPSAATIAFLIDKVKADQISTVYYIEFSNHKVADSVAESTKTNTALFHSCHNVSAQDIESNVTYVSLMEENLNTLKNTMK